MNIYCDESCHLEKDHETAMVLGGVSCPAEKSREIADRIREIKARHGLAVEFEAKWSKISPGKTQLYIDLVDYFFDDDDLHFRALVVPNKSVLDHERFGQDHDTWYYKMYYQMLVVLLDPQCQYQIFLDIKDTRSARKVAKLHEILANKQRDFERLVVRRVQTVRSEEVQQVQLADLLVGAVSFVNRGLDESPDSSAAKKAVVQRIRHRSRYSLKGTTFLRESKFNLLTWRPDASLP